MSGNVPFNKPDMYFVGILQGSWKGTSSQAASDCESSFLQPVSRTENQGSGRMLCTDSIICNCGQAFMYNKSNESTCCVNFVLD